MAVDGDALSSLVTLLAAAAVWAFAAPSVCAEHDAADGSRRRTIRALRLEAGEQIDVDGRLDEPAWQRAGPAGDFRQQDPGNGAPATEPTTVRIAYDGDRLYCAFRPS